MPVSYSTRNFSSKKVLCVLVGKTETTENSKLELQFRILLPAKWLCESLHWPSNKWQKKQHPQRPAMSCTALHTPPPQNARPPSADACKFLAAAMVLRKLGQRMRATVEEEVWALTASTSAA